MEKEVGYKIKKRLTINRKTLKKLGGTGGRNRTDKGSPPADFESAAFTSFTTPAHRWVFMEF